MAQASQVHNPMSFGMREVTAQGPPVQQPCPRLSDHLRLAEKRQLQNKACTHVASVHCYSHSMSMSHEATSGQLHLICTAVPCHAKGRGHGAEASSQCFCNGRVAHVCSSVQRSGLASLGCHVHICPCSHRKCQFSHMALHSRPTGTAGNVGNSLRSGWGTCS